MKARKFVLCLLIISAAFSLAAQEAKDVVLVVDTSASMFAYYNEINTYLTGPFLVDNVKSGDTLHIISYASKPRFEIARRVTGQGDIETVSGRIWLLYPLEVNSDPGGAINYAEQYARSIPGGRAKKVFVISDDDNAEGLAAAAADRLKPAGTELIFIRAAKNIRSPGGSQVASTPSTTPSAAAPQGTTPGGTAAQGTTPGGTGAAGAAAAGASAATETGSGAAASANGTGATGTVDATGTTGSGATGTGATGTGDDSDDSSNGTTAGGTTGPETTENSGQGTGAESSGNGIIDGGNNALATGQSTDQSAAASQPFSLSSIPLPVWLGLLLLLLILLIIFLVTRRLHDSPNKAVASARTDDSAAKNADLLNSFASRQAAAALQGTPRRSQYRDPGSFPTNPPMLNLFVEEQNTAIGRRNVHALKRGSTYTVGGGNSDFLIFLVPVPSRLGHLYFDGNNCTFTPSKPKYFPDIGSTPVHECIGKTIRLLSDKNYEVFFHFERYKDPLIALNQLLHSIQVPEPPEGRKE